MRLTIPLHTIDKYLERTAGAHHSNVVPRIIRYGYRRRIAGAIIEVRKIIPIDVKSPRKRPRSARPYIYDRPVYRRWLVYPTLNRKVARTKLKRGIVRDAQIIPRPVEIVRPERPIRREAALRGIAVAADRIERAAAVNKQVVVRVAKRRGGEQEGDVWEVCVRSLNVRVGPDTLLYPIGNVIQAPHPGSATSSGRPSWSRWRLSDDVCRIPAHYKLPVLVDGKARVTVVPQMMRTAPPAPLELPLSPSVYVPPPPPPYEAPF